ncbi:dipeptidase PepV [Ornithinibacillus salinisoli]|uniref:Dipeptidase PepV n=1 Tax=Ornithinibacillus salinisoli TaxID=1848459 RepID=A0ABW4W1Q9_9BACI
MKTWENLFEESDFIQDLSDLLAIPSIKQSNPKEGMTFGEDIQKALSFMLAKGEEEGLLTYQHDGLYGYIEFGPKEAKDYIAVLCHVDVVPASGKWTNPPFEPYVENNRIYARGAIDDKGPTMAAWYALKLLIKSEYPIKHRIRLIIGTNEESGMNCMKSYVANEPEALFGFAPDAQFPIIHAEKGQINLELSCKPKYAKDTINLESFQAGTRGNMVPDIASAVIKGKFTQEQLQRINQLEQIHEDVSMEQTDEHSFTIRTVGVSAHGMEPFKGQNAAFSLASILLSLEELQFHPYLTFIQTYLKNDFYGQNLGIDFEDNIAGKLTVNAGILHYDLEKGGTIQLNIRCPIETPYEKTIDQLKALADQKGWFISNQRSTQPHYVHAEHDGIKALQVAYEKVTNNKATLLSTGGATYARFLTNGVAFGAVFPGKTNTAHQVDEYAELDDLKKATLIYAEALYRLANI